MEQVPTLKDATDVANAFNNFFTTITEKLNIQQVEKGDAILVLKDSFSRNSPSIKIIPITEAEIKSTMHSVKPKKIIRLLGNKKENITSL
jgi:hypothetical protein